VFQQVMPARRVVMLLALVTGLTVLPTAHAARPRPVGQGTIVTDDVRFAVFAPQSGEPLRVIDTSTGAVRELPTPPDYRLGGVGGGQALWTPSGYESFERHDPPSLTDLVTGATRSPPGSDQAWGPYPGRTFGSVEHLDAGRHWIAVGEYGYHEFNTGYLDWHTGEYVGTDPGPATSRPNLDRPDLMEPICRPFKRKAAKRDIDAIDPWLPIEYQRPFMTFERDGRIRLSRCGSHRSIALFRTHDKPWCYACGSAERRYSPIPTRPVWAGRGRIAPIRAYLSHEGRAVTLAKMRKTPPGRVSIAQTRTRIFVTIRDSRVYWLPAPRQAP
jgi:hypothetical protein